jgi:hypothetical protein
VTDEGNLMRRWLILGLMAVFLSACNLGTSSEPLPTFTPIGGTNIPSNAPQVVIDAPRGGEEFVVNDPLFVETTISDTVGVTSVQLRANNQPVQTRGIESSNSQLVHLVLDYTPRVTGDVVLSVIAYRGNVASQPATVEVRVRDAQAQVTATAVPGDNRPIIDPNDPYCRALVHVGLNFRDGPDTSFNVIRLLGAGEVLRATGRLSNNSWWQLTDPRTGRTGWVNNAYISLYDGTAIPCRNIQVIAPPATTAPPATLTPLPTLVPPTPIPPSATTPPTATAIPLPNLGISQLFCPESVTIPAGESDVNAEISLNITNSGGVLNQQFTVEARIESGRFDVGTYGSLQSGQTLNAKANVRLSKVGSNLVVFVVDSNNDVEESDETNNERSCLINVIQGSS